MGLSDFSPIRSASEVSALSFGVQLIFSRACELLPCHGWVCSPGTAAQSRSVLQAALPWPFCGVAPTPLTADLASGPPADALDHAKHHTSEMMALASREILELRLRFPVAGRRSAKAAAAGNCERAVRRSPAARPAAVWSRVCPWPARCATSGSTSAIRARPAASTEFPVI